MEEEYRFENIYPDDVKLSDFILDMSEHNMADSFLTNEAISYLMNQEVLFANSRPYVNNPWMPKEKWETSEETLVLFVSCGDTFAWGGSDAESITYSENIGSEIYQLLEYYLENRTYGVTKWVCIKRNQQPQKPLADSMKRDGIWNDIMESLPHNKYDYACYETTGCTIRKPDTINTM